MWQRCVSFLPDTGRRFFRKWTRPSCFPALIPIFLQMKDSLLVLVTGFGLLIFALSGFYDGAVGPHTTTSAPVSLEQVEADTSAPSSSADLVSVDLRLAATPVPAGETVRAAAVLDIKEGWHVNAHRPTYDYLIGTSLDWVPVSDVSADNVQYPEPERLHLDFAGGAIDVYEGTTPIFFDVHVSSSAEPGGRQVAGRLRVQACNDRMCLSPSTVKATLSIPVREATATATPTGDSIFEAQASAPAWNTVTAVLQRHGLFIAGGLLVLGTVLFLVVYSWIAPGSEE